MHANQFYQKYEKQSLEVRGIEEIRQCPIGKGVPCQTSATSLSGIIHWIYMDLFQCKNELKQTNERKVVENCMHSCGNMNAVAKASLLTITPCMLVAGLALQSNDWGVKSVRANSAFYPSGVCT